MPCPGPPSGTGAGWRSPIDHPCTPLGDSATRVCVRIVELSHAANPNNPPSVRQDVLVSEKGLDLYQGGVAYSAAGDLHVVCGLVRVPADRRPSRLPARRRPGGAVQQGRLRDHRQGPVHRGAWGDAVVLAQDPVDAFAIWQGHEYASADGRWATRVTQARLPGATFHPLTPTRLLDTRFGNGLPAQFVTNTPRTFQVTGRGGIPANAIAVTGNLSVTGQIPGSGYAALTPAPTVNPPTSTINFPLADTRGNNVTLSLGAGGRLSAVFKGAAGAKTHLIFDVTGYFVRNNTGSTYVPLEPVRLLNTRTGNGLPDRSRPTRRRPGRSPVAAAYRSGRRRSAPISPCSIRPVPGTWRSPR